MTRREHKPTVIPEWLRMGRAKVKLTLREVWERTKIPFPSLCNYESGKSETPAPILLILSGLYRVHPCWFYGCEMHGGWDHDEA